MRKSKISKKLDKLDAGLTQVSNYAKTEEDFRIIDTGNTAVDIAREVDNNVRVRCMWTIVTILAMIGLRRGDAVVEFYVGCVVYPILMTSIVRTAMKKRTVTKNIRVADAALKEITNIMLGRQK